MMPNIDFSFQISPSAGLADKLAFQFSFLYTLGSRCGWRYRLIEPVLCTRIIRFDGRRKRLLRKAAKLTRLDHTKGYQKIFPSDSVAPYLGLEQPEASMSDYPLVLDVPLADLLENVTSLDDVNQRLISLIEAAYSNQASAELKPERILVRITKDHSFYLLLNRIKEVLSMTTDEINIFAGDTYLRPHINTSKSGLAHLPLLEQLPSQRIPLVHLRLGDSLYLSTEKGLLILSGGTSYFSLQEYIDQVKPIDPDRRPWFDPYQISCTVHRELADRKLDPTTTFLISDGFKPSRLALKAIAHKYPDRVSPALLAAASRRINELEKQFKRAFDWVPKDQLIIGDGDGETIQSLHLIAHSKLILCNSGGFSLFMSRIYGLPGDKPEFVWLVKDF